MLIVGLSYLKDVKINSNPDMCRKFGLPFESAKCPDPLSEVEGSKQEL
jgi:hypothetical protein